MKSNGESVKPMLLMFDLGILMLGIIGYGIFCNFIYSKMDIKVDKDKVIEYGEEKYNLKDFILDSNGDIIEIGDIDTSKVGKQDVTVTLSKYNLSKDVTFSVNVVDKVAPVIELKNNDITIKEGESLDLLDNIASVKDAVDGDLSYSDNENANTYTINGSFDSNSAGTYTLEVKAVDKSNNVSVTSFNVKVEEKPKPVYREQVYAPAGANGSASGIVSTAYSLLGSPYVGGGNSPAGFDCSGFVQYVYGLNGKYISRSTSTQVYDGVGVNRNDAQPGDIILWGYPGGYVTHSSLYVGNDMMIHAANPSTGVILSSVSGWERGSDVSVLYVRRVVG